MKFVGEGSEAIVCNRYPNFDIEAFMVERDLDWKAYDSGDHKEIAINCPECVERGEGSPDTKKKLWINPEKGTFYCYRCQWAGSLVKLIQRVTNSPFTTALKILRGSLLDPMEHMDLKLYIEKPEPDDVEDELREIELPYGYEPIDGPHPYLKKRGIPWRYAAENDWGVGAAGFTKDRIIVPTFMEGKVVFWQARATWEESEHHEYCDSPEIEFKKVLNPKGVSARSVLYNYDVARDYETIIVVEGFIDAVKTGPDAVATNGKMIHPQQVEWLKNSKAKEIVLMWDYDAWTDSKKYKGKVKPSSIQKATELLRAYGFKVRAVKLPEGRDPGSFRYQSSELREYIDAAKEPKFSKID